MNRIGPARAALTISVQLRYNDLDRYNHVTNVAYFELMECARNEFLRPMKWLDAAVVARAEVDYVAEIPGGTRSVDVTITTERIGRTSFTFGYEIHNGDKLCGTGRTVLVALDSKRRPRELTPAERGELETGPG